MITDFSVTVLHGINENDVWFQQNVATYHTSHATINLLCQTFDGHLISRNVYVNWPPRNYNRTLQLDTVRLFSVGSRYIKMLCRGTKDNWTLEDLRLWCRWRYKIPKMYMKTDPIECVTVRPVVVAIWTKLYSISKRNNWRNYKIFFIALLHFKFKLFNFSLYISRPVSL